MTDFSAYEQLMLELVNRARMNPLAEAARLGIGLNSNLPVGTITAIPKQPLAGNEFLLAAAEGHSQHMLDTSQFNHAGIGDGTPTSRMQAAGYTLTGSWMTGENIAWVGTTGQADMLQMTLDINDNLFRSALHRENILTDGFRELGTGVLPGSFTSGGTAFNSVMATQNFGLSGSSVFVTGVAINDNLFRSALHRKNILTDGFRELGTGVLPGNFTSGGTAFNSVMATQNFGLSGSSVFVTGVAINDINNDNFYGIGEGRSGISVSVTTAGLAATGISKPAGGFSVATASGAHDITFSGGDLAASVSVTVSPAAQNVKVDLSGADKILSSATTALGAGAINLVLLGASKINGTGNDGDNTIEGNVAGNVLSGGLGNDTLVGGLGRDVLTGGGGNDVFDFNRAGDSIRGVNRDLITDFRVGEDKFDLSGIDANTKIAGDQGFAFIGAALFHHVAGELRAIQYLGRTYVCADVNGDAVTDFQLDLQGKLALKGADFIL